MIFVVDDEYIEGTERELECRGYSCKSLDRTWGDGTMIETDAEKVECQAAVCRAFLEKVKLIDGLVPITKEESEDIRIKIRLSRELGRKTFVVFGSQEEILPQTNFSSLD